IGVYAVGRMLTAGRGFPAIDPGAAGPAAQPPPPPGPDAPAGVPPGIGLAPFFFIHYGGFWVVPGIFRWVVLHVVFSGVMAEPGIGTGFGSPFDTQVTYPDPQVVLTAACILLVSHGVSFVANWLIGGEHLTSTPEAETKAPYTRVVILHM